MNEFKKKFKIDELLIFSLNGWNVSLRPAQVTLGSLVLSLDRKCPELSQLTIKETSGLSEVFKKIETLLKISFNPDKINYLALMMVDHQVHFHVIPRYENTITFDGKNYKDENWPKPPNVLSGYDMSSKELIGLFNFLKEKSV